MKSSTAISCIMRRIKTGIALTAGILCLAACSQTKEAASQTTVTLSKDGTVASHIMESFKQSYYDQEELKQKILSEAAAYNRKAGGGNISVDKVEVSGSQVEVKMTYAEAADYAAFNKVIFFAGTPEQAQEAGYDLNVVLSGVKNSSETVGQSDILQMEDMRLLIFNTGDVVVLNGKAVYASDNAVVSGSQKSVSGSADKNEMLYILYK